MDHRDSRFDVTDCGCRKGAVVAGCPRHSVLARVPRQRTGWWHRLLIHLASRGRGLEDAQTRKGKATSGV